MASYAKFDVWQDTNGNNRETVLQVVESSYSSMDAYSSISDWTDTAFTGTITPILATSRILLLTTVIWDITNETTCLFRWTRNNIVFGVTGTYDAQYGEGNNTSQAWATQTSYSIIDTPNTNLPITYTLQIRPYDTNRTVRFNNSATGSGVDDAQRISKLIMMEIAS